MEYEASASAGWVKSTDSLGVCTVFWQDGAGQVAFGFISNLVFVVILTAVGLMYVRGVITHRSRPLRRLLGVGGSISSRIRVMVSNIYVVQGGTLGARTNRTGFYGPVMNQSEYTFALRLAEAVRTRPAARMFRALLDQLGLLDAAHEPLNCSIGFSPQYVDTPEDGGPVIPEAYTVPDLSGDGTVAKQIADALAEPNVYILVGGPVYNAAVLYTLTHLRERTRFRFELRDDGQTHERGISVAGYEQDGSERFFRQQLPTPGKPMPDYFILQKISKFGPGKATVFLCSGLSSLGTAMAVHLLATRWEQLAREFRDKDDFELLYEFYTDKGTPVPDLRDVESSLNAAERLWPKPQQRT